jgi:protein tyrosine/serine phosphatase
MPLLLGALLVIGASFGCARTLYNFGEVREAALYRSAQPSPLFLSYVTRRHGVRTLVNLRGKTPGYESAFAARHGLRLFVFDLSASRPPSHEEVDRFLRIVGNPENHPVLVHCRNGVDRSGYMVGSYRTEQDGWTSEEAVREMNRFLQFEWPNPVPQRVVRNGLRQP